MRDEPELLSVALASEHRLGSFRCGRPPLDAWLREQALRAQVAGTARTRVWIHRGEQQVLAYFSIAPTQLVRADGLSRSRLGGFTVAPAFLLARLALGQQLHGQGLGSQLLLDALETVVAAAHHGGGRLLVVEAIDDGARAFYEHHNFSPVGDGRRLIIKIATIEAQFDEEVSRGGMSS